MCVLNELGTEMAVAYPAEYKAHVDVGARVTGSPRASCAPPARKGPEEVHSEARGGPSVGAWR